jgi:hypothetical protein
MFQCHIQATGLVNRDQSGLIQTHFEIKGIEFLTMDVLRLRDLLERAHEQATTAGGAEYSC